MNGIKINIDSEKINKMVSEAIIESTLGEAVRNCIKKATKDLTASYNNPLQAVITAHISDLVMQVLMADYQPVIKKQVEEKIAVIITDEFIGKIIDAGLKRFG